MRRPLLLLLFTFIDEIAARYSCKGLDGKNVDWFVIYKLPNGAKNSSDGKSFLYADQNNPEWTLGKKLIDDKSAPIGATIQQVYKNEQSSFSFLYNDDSPIKKNSDGYRGHTKGVLLFDSATGFWLSHSVPNFPPLGGYGYPATGVKFAQSFMCVTVSTDQLVNIGEQMKFMQATPFDFRLPEKFGAKFPILRTITQKKSLPSSATVFTSVKHMQTVGGTKFVSMAKHKKFAKDLWLDLVVPSAGASLGVQSWLNGGADDLKSKCSSQGSVYDITEIGLLGYNFSSSKDHSKWAVSDDARIPLVCVGDLNRQKSQLSRGGGALCLENNSLWSTYRKSVNKVEPCTPSSVASDSVFLTLSFVFLLQALK